MYARRVRLARIPHPVRTVRALHSSTHTAIVRLTHSNTGTSTTCIPCPFFFILSRHCDVPVIGIITAFVLSLLVGIVVFYLVKKYRKQRDVSRRLAKQLRKHKQLIKASKDDIALMGAAWRIQEDEVEFIDKLASGAYVR